MNNEIVNQNGLAPILIVVLLIVAALGGYLLYQNQIRQGSDSQSEVGYLEGKVSIGPLCPLSPCDISDEQLAQVYTSRKITVYHYNDEFGKNPIMINPDPKNEGYYKIGLKSGVYTIDLKSESPIEFSKNLPQEVTIRPNQTTRLDISIDTGIR